MRKFFVLCLVIFLIGAFMVGCSTTPDNPSNENTENSEAKNNSEKESYPIRPVTSIVAWGAGGGCDVTARLLGEYFQDITGQPQPIINMPGAGAEIGFVELKNSKADGYTVGLLAGPTIVGNILDHEAGYKLEDFEWIIGVSKAVRTISVSGNSPFKTLEDLIKWAKENPGKLQLANGGHGTHAHLTFVDFADKAGIEVKHVPFDGSASSMTAVLGGHCDASSPSIGEVLELAKSGEMRVLAVFDEERSEELPDVPTAREVGVDAVHLTLRGIGGPKGIPEDRVKILHDTYKKAMENPEFIKKFTADTLSYREGKKFEKDIAYMLETYKPVMDVLKEQQK
ncbi:MAG: tripartite tricarboxylate transporter substrate binding protein [Peptococcaceae bacterium]